MALNVEHLQRRLATLAQALTAIEQQAATSDSVVDVHLWSRLPQTFHAAIEAAYVEIQAVNA